MGSTSTLHSLHALWRSPQIQCSLDKPLGAPSQACSFRTESFFKTSFMGQNLRSSNVKRMSFLPHVKASEAASDLASAADSLTKSEQSSSAGENVQKSAFPNGLEKLILELCDETTIAELKIKIADFEMYVRRDISSSNALIPTIPPIALPLQAPPIPSKAMSESGPLAPPAAVPQKPPHTPSSPFINVPSAKDAKLAALEASGVKTYVIVASPTVGSFRRARTLKGKKQPPSCKEGDMIKEGQIIGYLDQFGNELPIRADVAGEVLKILYQDGEAVGYGDPLMAVLPAFPGIN